LIAIAVTLLGDLAVISLKISQFGLAVSGGSLFRWFSTIALFYAVWRGYRWARWLIVGLLGLGLLFVVPLMLQSFNLLTAGVALQFVIAIVLLAIPRSVSAFIGYQRARYGENT